VLRSQSKPRRAFVTGKARCEAGCESGCGPGVAYVVCINFVERAVTNTASQDRIGTRMAERYCRRNAAARVKGGDGPSQLGKFLLPALFGSMLHVNK
jgi:hypothetical protein